MTDTTFTLRAEGQNPRHVYFTVFANGANCGQLTMTREEYSAFARILLVGARRMPTVEVWHGQLVELDAKGDVEETE